MKDYKFSPPYGGFFLEWLFGPKGRISLDAMFGSLKIFTEASPHWSTGSFNQTILVEMTAVVEQTDFTESFTKKTNYYLPLNIFFWVVKKQIVTLYCKAYLTEGIQREIYLEGLVSALATCRRLQEEKCHTSVTFNSLKPVVRPFVCPQWENMGGVGILPTWWVWVFYTFLR